MNWLFISVVAQIVLGTSAVFDKILLRRGFFDPISYTFWSAILGLSAFVLVPFGSLAAPLEIIFIALLGGVFFIIATYFFFLALKLGEASVALPIIGGLAPISTLIFASIFLDGHLSGGQLAGFLLLVFGGIFFLGAERREVRPVLFLVAFSSAVLFGISNVLTKIVFDASSFVAGLVWVRVGGAFAMTVPLFSPSFRGKIAASLHAGEVKHRFLYVLNRVYSAGGILLLSAALFLAYPALVDASSSLKYVVIVVAAWLMLQERFHGRVLVFKIVGIFLIVGGLAGLALVEYARSIPVDSARNIGWGVTFSQKFSEQLGLDWQKNFDAILTDLKPKKIRLVAYWDEIEKWRGVYDFSDLDWLLLRSRNVDAEVIFVIGMKVPRWPECFIPSWVDPLAPEEREDALREYMRMVVERYKKNPEIKIWQVENEPYLAFGECPDRPDGFLEKEIALVKSIDPSRPVLVTDGGEFGDWYRAVMAGDVFGTTMYRKVYPRFLGPIFGVIEYPIAPSFFPFKEKLVRFLTGERDKLFLAVELQGEAWGEAELHLLPLEEQFAIFPPEYFQETIEYARETGFDEYYLWGAEWWYWLKEKQNKPEMWDIAKETIQSTKK